MCSSGLGDARSILRQLLGHYYLSVRVEKCFAFLKEVKKKLYQLLIDENVHLITFTSDGFEVLLLELFALISMTVMVDGR